MGENPAPGEGNPRAAAAAADPGNPKLGGRVRIDAIDTIEIPAAPVGPPKPPPAIETDNGGGGNDKAGGLEAGETESLRTSGEDLGGEELNLYWDRSVGLVGFGRELSILVDTRSPFSIHLFLSINVSFCIIKTQN